MPAARRTPLIAAIPLLVLAASPLHPQASAATPHPGTRVLGDGQLLAVNDAGLAVGGGYLYDNGKQGSVVGPLGRGQNSNLVAVNNRGQILVAQKLGPLRYFLYDPTRKDFTPIGLMAQVNENGTPVTVQLGYLTGLDDAGDVYGAYARGHGPCGVIGRPSTGTPGDLGPPPSAPAVYELVGCTGPGSAIHAINSKRQMTGSVGPQGFLWSDGKLSTFAFPGSVNTYGAGINEAGVVVGNFLPGYAVSDAGVITPHEKPGFVVGTGYIYDGHQFRYVALPHTGVTLTGINNRGQVVGWFDSGGGLLKGFVGPVESFPVTTMAATWSELTAQAVDKKLAAPHNSGNDVEATYKILRDRVGLTAAADLRALEALESTGPLPLKKRVEVQHDIYTYDYITAEDLRNRVIGGLVSDFMAELSVAQHNPTGTDAVVDAVAALAGDDGLRDLRAAGELNPFGHAVLNSPSNQFTAAARAKFRTTITAAVSASLGSHPLGFPPSNLEIWAYKGVPAELLDQFDKTLRLVNDQLGLPSARIFLAWSQARGSGIGELFGWEAVEQLVEMNTRGEHLRAEAVIRTLAGVPAPAKCSGIAELKASGGDRDDQGMILRNGTNPRHDLANAMNGIGSHLLMAIDAKGKPTVASTTSVPASAPPRATDQPPASRTPAPAPTPPPNAFASPTGTIFSGTNATLGDGSITFTLKAPSDSRNNQMMTFKGLLPLAGQSTPPKAWITQDADGYVAFSMLVPGVITGQVLPGASGKPAYDKAKSAQGAP